jgi:outer membrane protein assembly factor BamB
MGRRILLCYLALTAAIVLVVGVGTALQPSYASLRPWLGITVDDIRSAPTSSPWAVDLAATLAPGAPAECLRFTASDVGQDLVLVRAESAWTFGYSADTVCTSVPAGFESRVALLNTANGAVPWVHDAASDLPTTQGVAISSATAIDHASKVLIQAGSSTTTVIETLAMSTGQVIGSTGEMAWSEENRFTSNGDVVAIGSLSADALTYRYQLRNADHLSKVVWSGGGNETSTMIALSDRLLLGDEATKQVLLSNGAVSRWGPAVNTGLGYTVHDDTVFAVHTRGSGVTTLARNGFSALSKDGKVLWQSDLALRGSYSLTRSCLAVTDRSGNRLSCLDYATGKTKWTVNVAAFSSAASAPGQRSDDVFAISATDRAHVVDLDGATGRQKFAAEVPTGSSIVAAGHTVAYALAYGITGARSNVIAVDLSSGRRLWTESSQLQFALWGGHLIDIGVDGFARRLYGPS